MRATALAVDEEGEEEEEEEEDEVRGGHNGAQRATMYPFGSKERRRHPGIGTPLIFFLVFGCLLIIAVASPLHPVPPHRGITLSSYIGYYEVASYDTAALRQHSNRMRRDVSDAVDNQPLLLQLKALDKQWTLRLIQDKALFSKDATFESTNGPIDFDTSHSYVGTVLEDDNAMVQGIVTEDGLFDGTVVTGFEEYYIEPTNRYLNKEEDTSPTYHSIAYRASDVLTPRRSLPCASHQLHQSATHDSTERGEHDYGNDSRTLYEPLLGERQALYSKENGARVLTLDRDKSVTRMETSSDGDRIARHLHKRATVDPRKTTCMLYLQADHQFFARYGTEEACIEVMTRHVQRVNSIYKHTDFNQDGRPDNISFMIKRVKVHSEDALRDPNYRFPGNYGVEKYLELFSALSWQYEVAEHRNSDFAELRQARTTRRFSRHFGPRDRSQLRLTEPQVSLCGNGVIEEGEECDCGWEEDCRDSCCFPQRRYPPPGETPCTLTPGSICSPSQGPCCTAECNLRFGDKCRDDNGCRDASFCDGRSPYCPPSINKPNKTICNREFVCFMGECTGSICLAYGLESCQCIPGPNDPPTKACELCCRLPGENQPCLSSFDWNSPPYDIPDMFSKPGTPCNDYNGYCDVFQKCREVDPSGPLATLRKLLLSDESLATFRRWIIDHWYAAAFIIVAAVSLLVASMRLLGKRPDLKLKSVTIIHSSTTETVRLPPEGTEGVTVHPPAVRAKLPLSRKVREKRRHRKHKDSHGNVDKSGKDASKKKKQPQSQTKRISANATEDFARKRSADVTPAMIQENKRKKTFPSRDKQNSNGNVSSADNEKRKRKKQHKKEVIDYSAIQAEKETEPNADPKSKVRSWLLASSQCRPETGRSNATGLPKSKSTPVGLTGAGTRLPATRQAVSRRPTESKETKTPASSGARKERAKLQVVYKPPFRFSVKLRKSDKVAQVPALAPNTTHVNGRPKLPRTGVLLRTAKKKDRVRIGRARQIAPTGIGNSAGDLPEPANSDLHTVPSDLEVLLSESEFLFSDT
ncbi:disintegrin and metalloproteinase domain-containing protein 10 isoform X2 [Bombus fervidus]|uniref:disintegrin and metalloproteinase domain-containing protein 10 isoform X2 n=1 Tax=Bombus fervidus TaxID=203811 RepID=UPI003AB27DAE